MARMVIPLVNCPSWHMDYPPYNISLLKAVLSQNGLEAVCFDLNEYLYNQITDSTEKQTWLPMSKGKCWEQKEFVAKLFEKYRDTIEGYITKIIDLDSRVIGFTVNDRNIHFTKLVAEMIKRIAAGKKIIFGGPACFRVVQGINVLSESCADAICIGEGEVSFVNFLKIINRDSGLFTHCPGFAFKSENGDIVDCGDGAILENLNLLPFADYSDFDISKYLTRGLSLLTSKGCINRCAFCSEKPRMNKYRVRSAQHVFSEITHQLSVYPHVNYLWFNDSLMNGDIAMLDSLCTLLLKNNISIQWGGQAVIRKEMTIGLLKKMKDAGCHCCSYGVESGSDAVLKLMHKGYNAALAEKVLEDTFNAGIGINFNIIIGFPGETEKEFQETVLFVKRTMKYANTITLNVLSLDLGSELSVAPYRWNIRFAGKSYVQDWVDQDGMNNLQERIRRLRILNEILGNKTSTDFLDSNDNATALKEINKDKNFEWVIKEKIRSCENNKISFKWDLHYKCNFRCPYCWFYREWANLNRLNLYFSPDEWMVHWKRIYDKYREGNIEIRGGEPFIYPRFIEIIRELSRFHTINISTNLSCNIERIIKEWDPLKVKIHPTFHPIFSKLDDFKKKAKALKEAGFTQEITFLAYPPQIKQLNYYKEIFQKENLSFFALTFWGRYNSQDYPSAYTEEEKKIINPNLAQCGGESFQTSPIQSPRGKLCYAGSLHACIHPDGKVFRCGGGGAGGFSEMIGNFFDEEFRLLNEPLPCPSDICPCNEWAFLLEERINKKENSDTPSLERQTQKIDGGREIGVLDRDITANTELLELSETKRGESQEKKKRLVH